MCRGGQIDPRDVSAFEFLPFAQLHPRNVFEFEFPPFALNYLRKLLLALEYPQIERATCPTVFLELSSELPPWYYPLVRHDD